MNAAEALLIEAVQHAEWQDKRIHPVNGETYQAWKLTVYLPVPLSQADKSPEAALRCALGQGTPATHQNLARDIQAAVIRRRSK